MQMTVLRAPRNQNEIALRLLGGKHRESVIAGFIRKISVDNYIMQAAITELVPYLRVRPAHRVIVAMEQPFVFVEQKQVRVEDIRFQANNDLVAYLATECIHIGVGAIVEHETSGAQRPRQYLANSDAFRRKPCVFLGIQPIGPMRVEMNRSFEVEIEGKSSCNARGFFQFSRENHDNVSGKMLLELMRKFVRR